MRRAARPERSRVGPSADRHAAELARKLGKALRDGRTRAGLTQAQAAARAGFSQGAWSRLETNSDPRYTLATWDRAAFAVGTSLHAYLADISAAGLPRDAAHLKGQELVLKTAAFGGWHGLPEERLDPEARTSRFGDVVLQRPKLRPKEVALVEIIDWFDDVGAPMRDWPRRLEALEKRSIGRMSSNEDLPTISGCWLVRATKRNRELIAEHSNLFHSRFPGSGPAWLAALTQPHTTMPADAGLLWISVNGERLYPATRAVGRW
jgi:transcriptional regulator with XRE-family HTH domain